MDGWEDARRTWKWTRLFRCEDQAWLWGAETEVGGNDQDDSSNDDEMRMCTITGEGMQRAPQSSNAKRKINWNQERVTWVMGNDLLWREVLTKLQALQASRGQARSSRENLFAVVRFLYGRREGDLEREDGGSLCPYFTMGG